MGAPLTPLEAPENPALDEVGCVGVLHRYKFQIGRFKSAKIQLMTCPSKRKSYVANGRSYYFHFLQKITKMSLQIAYQQRPAATPNPRYRSPLRSINLNANLTEISQLSQGTIGSKESAVQCRQHLQDEIHQPEWDDAVVPETAPTPTMALMDIDVARDRAAGLLNNSNPVATSHSAGASLPYPYPPEENADVDDEVEIDPAVDIDLDIEVDAALDVDAAGVFDDDDAAGDGDGDDDDDSSSYDDDVDPLHLFHPGTFSVNDAVVETLRLYGDVRKDPKRRIISQRGEASHVNYEQQTNKLSPGESKFCLTTFYLYSISHSLFLFLRTENQFDYFLMKATTVPCMMSKKTFWNTLVTG
jgi:hypothetical protein